LPFKPYNDSGGTKLPAKSRSYLLCTGSLGGTLGIGSKKVRSSEGAKESVEGRAIMAAQYSRMTTNCDVAGFLPLLQSGPRLTLNTQGFRQASTLG
jgi:hypothetical protein